MYLHLLGLLGLLGSLLGLFAGLGSLLGSLLGLLGSRSRATSLGATSSLNSTLGSLGNLLGSLLSLLGGLLSLLTGLSFHGTSLALGLGFLLSFSAGSTSTRHTRFSHLIIYYLNKKNKFKNSIKYAK
jgi:hypothetical protein